MLKHCLCILAVTLAMGNLALSADDSPVVAEEPADSSSNNNLPYTTFGDDDVWKVKLGDVCQLNRFPLPASEPEKFIECLKPNQDATTWPWPDKGLWVMKQCLGGTEFYALTRSCKSKRYIRRQQSLCQNMSPTPSYCPQPTSQPIAIQPVQQQMQCQCPPNVQTCACPQPQTSVIQPTSVPSINIQILCQQQPQNSMCQCPPSQTNCPPPPPQPCPLASGGAGNAQVGGICSWMLAPLAADPSNNKCFLQCHPAPGNFYCGRWVRMPCAPATIFDVSVQVCVNDPNNQPGPVNPQPQMGGYGGGQNCNCGCQVGTNIGQCNSQNQCPGQSVCQAAQPQTQSSNCQQQCSINVCCYTGGGKRK